jgi:hypothetical protein
MITQNIKENIIVRPDVTSIFSSSQMLKQNDYHPVRYGYTTENLKEFFPAEIMPNAKTMISSSKITIYTRSIN